MVDKLKDKVAIVTGSGQGIGKALAIALAGEGAKVVTNNRKPSTSGEDAEATAKEIIDMGGQAVPFFGEIGSMEVGQKIIDTAIDNFGRIDILVNNAGINRSRMLWNMTEEEWDDVIKVILKGTFACTKPAAIKMREQRSGRIINIISEAGLDGAIGQPNYSAAKAGLIGFTLSCALALGKSGITVNAVAPQADTRMWQAMPPERAKQMIVARRLATTEEVAKLSHEEVCAKLGAPADIGPLIAYLGSDAAANINGKAFYAQGGRVALYTPWTQVQTIYKGGRWTVEELETVVPNVMAKNLVNPAPPEPPK